MSFSLDFKEHVFIEKIGVDILISFGALLSDADQLQKGFGLLSSLNLSWGRM